MYSLKSIYTCKELPHGSSFCMLLFLEKLGYF